MLLSPARSAASALVIIAACCSIARADPPKLSALAKMPVREITVFKDGHAFVLHEGAMPVDAAGNVGLDYLPTPVVGTFWPYSADADARLTSVVASRRLLSVDRTALSTRDLLEANVGADIVATDTSNKTFEARILGIPTQSTAESEANGNPAGSATGDDATTTYYDARFARQPGPAPLPLPQKGNVILLATKDGVRVMPIDHIADFTFVKPPVTMLGNSEYRNLLTMKLDWGAHAPARTAAVGMVYLQKGVRWIPSYRISLNGKGMATVKMQATLINEMTDLDDVTANLVIGVPSFKFQDTVDPMALQATMARLSQYFDTNSRSANAFSNAISTQVAGSYGVARRNDSTGDNPPGPDISDTSRNEDLFVFTVKHITLHRGERSVFPLATYSLPYKDVYTLKLPAAPPADLVRNYNSSQQTELAQLLGGPKVMHKIRLINKNDQPLSTAPVLIDRGGQLLAQSLMTYTAPGGKVDIEVTNAVDVTSTKTEAEVKCTPQATRWQGNDFERIDIEGKIRLCSYKDEGVDIEVERGLVGAIDAADNGGVLKKINVLDDDAIEFPTWWNWYQYNNLGWQALSGMSQTNWTVHLDPRKEIQLGYRYHYFWRQ